KLLRRDGLADIAGCPRLQRARHMDSVVVHAEDQNTRFRINDLQARDDLDTADIGQVQIENDEVGAISPESAQRLFSARRLLHDREPDFVASPLEVAITLDRDGNVVWFGMSHGIAQGLLHDTADRRADDIREILAFRRDRYLVTDLGATATPERNQILDRFP